MQETRVDRREEVRQRALKDLQGAGVLMLDGHFDFGNGFHGSVYINPHQLFLHPSTIWRFVQDLIDLLPHDLIAQTDLVAGPVTGGALIAHTMAGLLDARRSLVRPACGFAPFNADPDQGLTLRAFYRKHMEGRHVLLADDVRNTGKTLERCAELVKQAGGSVIGTVQIYDRLEAVVDLGVPNVALAEYRAPGNFPADRCPLCRTAVPITKF